MVSHWEKGGWSEIWKGEAIWRAISSSPSSLIRLSWITTLNFLILWKSVLGQTFGLSSQVFGCNQINGIVELCISSHRVAKTHRDTWFLCPDLDLVGLFSDLHFSKIFDKEGIVRCKSLIYLSMSVRRGARGLLLPPGRPRPSKIVCFLYFFEKK